MEEKEQLMTKQEVAEYLQVSTRTVDRLVKAGELAVHKVRTNVRFRREDIEKYLDSIKEVGGE